MDENSKKYKVVYEQVEQAKKALRLKTTRSPRPPSGYEYVPVGRYPDLTKMCKETSRQTGSVMYVVSLASKSLRPEQISHHIHRQGYHFQKEIVQKACAYLGYRLSHPGTGEFIREGFVGESEVEKALGRSRDDRSDFNENKRAEIAIQDLFPKIPEDDLKAILKRAFAEGTGRIGTVQSMSLSRRVQLAVTAHIRHVHTDYDSILRVDSWHNARQDVEQKCVEQTLKWRGEEAADDDEKEDLFQEVIILDSDEEDEAVSLEDPEVSNDEKDDLDKNGITVRGDGNPNSTAAGGVPTRSRPEQRHINGRAEHAQRLERGRFIRQLTPEDGNLPVKVTYVDRDGRVWEKREIPQPAIIHGSGAPREHFTLPHIELDHALREGEAYRLRKNIPNESRRPTYAFPTRHPPFPDVQSREFSPKTSRALLSRHSPGQNRLGVANSANSVPEQGTRAERRPLRMDSPSKHPWLITGDSPLPQDVPVPSVEPTIRPKDSSINFPQRNKQQDPTPISSAIPQPVADIDALSEDPRAFKRPRLSQWPSNDSAPNMRPPDFDSPQRRLLMGPAYPAKRAHANRELVLNEQEQRRPELHDNRPPPVFVRQIPTEDTNRLPEPQSSRSQPAFSRQSQMDNGNDFIKNRAIPLHGLRPLHQLPLPLRQVAPPLHQVAPPPQQVIVRQSRIDNSHILPEPRDSRPSLRFVRQSNMENNIDSISNRINRIDGQLPLHQPPPRPQHGTELTRAQYRDGDETEGDIMDYELEYEPNDVRL
ncbi:MAG: hypothetical protein M1820_000612 [Bogoriella megaspora]|nr:MAG: hypothetical protein M1820_000612 [Bogoriella megaspora]